MKVAAVVIRDAEGERRFTLDRLPLRLGTGSDCEIRLPGPGNAAVALIDELDGEPFVQPVGRSGLNINGQPLAATRRLAGGDELTFFGSRVVIDAADPDALLLTVELEDSAYITRPPEIAAGSAPIEETIAPTAFRRTRESSSAAPTATGYRWQAGVGTGIVLLLLVSWLLFSSKSIQFQIDPGAPDHLAVSGGWFRLPVGNRLLLRPGHYTVTVRKDGYYEVNQSLEVGDEPSRTVQIQLRRLPGKLTVMTDPATEAMVTVDDTNLGAAPFGPLVLEPGVHSVSVMADRFLPFSDRLVVPGLDHHQYLHVQLVPRWAEVEVSSNPSGAAIYRGEERLGTTPARLELMEGSHQLSVVREGFKAWDGIIETAPNEDKILPTIELEPANAQLQVNSIPLGASVTVNGRYRGQSPLTIALSPDVDYEIGLSKAGYGSAVRQIRLEAAATRAITVDMTAKLGTVTVRALPDDAEILVDGRTQGSGSATLNLSSAPHRLEVRKEGYQAYSRSITPRPGYPQTVEVRLLTDEEVRRQSVAASITTSQGQVLRRVEPRNFVMGSSRREQGRRANEVIVPVMLTKPFYIGEKEVTNREFLRFKQTHNSGGELHPALSGDNNPATNMTWAEAAEYCNWLSAEEGLPLAYEKKFEKWEPVIPVPNGYRLPTEAEWVLAIRYQGRSEATTFPWGDRMPPRK
ncbi:MAG TPA: PEGA domain-containing protein, partial [Woeseiaceae bacterium]